MNTMTTALLAEAGDPTLWTLFGRFHPATVHFPIALLTVAALLEGWQFLRKRKTLAPATAALIVIGFASAFVASLMGWSNASGRNHDDTVEAHRWAGVWTTILSLVAMLLVLKARGKEGKIVHAARVGLALAMILSGLTGHWGGQIVFGDSYYRSAAPSWLHWLFGKPTELYNGETTPPPVGKVDFEKEIAPILQASCLKCHGDLKPKGKLRLNTKENAMKGGENGPCIKPGKPDDSTLYTLLIDKDTDVRMPEKADPLPKAKIDRIKQWIQEGALWPDGYLLKPPEKK